MKMLLRVAVSVFFIGLLFYSLRDDLPGVLQTLRSVRPGYVALGVALYIAAALFLAVRLRRIFEVQDIPITLTQSVHITFIGFFFNTFLPTSVGGDIVKAYCGARLTRERLKSFISVLVDRLFGLFMFILVPAFTVFFVKDEIDPRVPRIVFTALAVSCLSMILIMKRGWTKLFSFLKPTLEKLRVKDKIVMIYDGMHHFKYHKRAVAEVMLTSVAAQTLGTLAVYFFIRAIGAEINVFYVFWLTPIVLLISMLPSIGGLGVRENAFKILYMKFIGVHAAVALGFIYVFMLFVMSLIGGIIYMTHHQYHFRMKEITAEPPNVLNGETR